MKASLLAQTLVQEFSTRVEFATRFDKGEITQKIFDFLQAGNDLEDRAQSVRLALLRSNPRSRPEDVIATAQEILDWPPKPQAKAEPVEKYTPVKPKRGSRRK